MDTEDGVEGSGRCWGSGGCHSGRVEVAEEQAIVVAMQLLCVVLASYNWEDSYGNEEGNGKEGCEENCA